MSKSPSAITTPGPHVVENGAGPETSRQAGTEVVQVQQDVGVESEDGPVPNNGGVNVETDNAEASADHARRDGTLESGRKSIPKRRTPGANGGTSRSSAESTAEAIRGRKD